MKIIVNINKAEIEVIRSIVPAEVLAKCGVDLTKEVSIVKRAKAAFNFVFAPEKGVEIEIEVDLVKFVAAFEEENEVDLATVAKGYMDLANIVGKHVESVIAANKAIYKEKYWKFVEFPAGLKPMLVADSYKPVLDCNFGEEPELSTQGNKIGWKIHPRREVRFIKFYFGDEEVVLLSRQRVARVQFVELDAIPTALQQKHGNVMLTFDLGE